LVDFFSMLAKGFSQDKTRGITHSLKTDANPPFFFKRANQRSFFFWAKKSQAKGKYEALRIPKKD
jgi:hypothetical protein